MKNIALYLTGVPYSGGTFQYNQSILEAAIALAANKFSLVVFYSDDLWLEYLAQYKIHTQKMKRSFFSRVIFRMVREGFLSVEWAKKITIKTDEFTKSFLSFNIDLLICPSQDNWSYVLPVDTLSTIHDLMHIYEKKFPEVSANKEFEYREYHYKNICKYSKGILVDSNMGKQHVLESYNRSYNVFALPFTVPKYLLSVAAAGKLDKKLPTKYLFYPAQFWEHKNHLNLILAIIKLKEQGVNVKFVFVGSKKNGYDRIIELIKAENLKSNIEILGYVSESEMVYLYNNARAMIMPTFFGPTNIPPLEGFAIGCPVAVSNIYGMPEQVGDAALTFDPNNIEEIADVIYNLWHDDKLCSELKEKGFSRIKAYSQENFNKRLENILCRMLY